MANHKSAAKRARQAITKTLVNTRIKSTVRTFEKKFLKAIESKDSEAAKGLLVTYTSKLDRGVKKGVFHSNLASRKVSRLTKKLNSLSV